VRECIIDAIILAGSVEIRAKDLHAMNEHGQDIGLGLRNIAIIPGEFAT
jgi:hypothetical protein